MMFLLISVDDVSGGALPGDSLEIVRLSPMQAPCQSKGHTFRLHGLFTGFLPNPPRDRALLTEFAALLRSHARLCDTDQLTFVRMAKVTPGLSLKRRQLVPVG